MSNEDKTGKGFLDELESLSNDTEKKPKKQSSVDIVENLLKTTLSEVGINADKLRTSVRAMEAEKKKEQEEMNKLDDLLEPIHKPVHETASDFLRSTVHEKIHEPGEEPTAESLLDVNREPVRETYHEPVKAPVLESYHEPVKPKEPFVPKPQERAEIFEKPKPTSKDVFPPLPEKKPAPSRPAPPLQRERLEAPAKKTDGIFDAYAEKPKKKFPVAIVAVAAVVVLGGIAAFLFMGKSGKSGTVAEPQPIVQADSSTTTTPGESPDSTLSQNPADSGTGELQAAPGEKPAPAAPAPKKTATSTPPASKQGGPSVSTQTGPASESTGAPSEPIQPIVPVTTPRVQEVKLAPTQTTGAAAAAGQPGTANPTPAEPPKKAKQGDLFPLDQVDTQPVIQQKFEATYPTLGRRMGIEGTVIVNALVSETGSVIRTNVIRKIQGSANYGFETASEDAVKKWKFKPAVKDGVNVKTWMPVAIVFRK